MPLRPSAGMILGLTLLLTLLGRLAVLSFAEDGSYDADREALAALVAESHYDEAIVLAQELVEEIRAEHGVDSLAEAKILDSWVEALYRSGHAMEEESLELAARALALKEAHLGPDDPEIAQSLLQSGNLHIYRAENAEARANYERALAILEAAKMRSSGQYAMALNNLGVTWKRSGDYAKALEIYRRSLALREELMGSEHPDVASTLNNLANVYIQLGDYAAATACHRRALAIREACFGPENEWVAESLHNLASVLGYAGEFDEALEVQERALEIFTETLGPENERYWAARLNLAVLESDMGDLLGARKNYLEVLENQERQFGRDHAELIETLDAVASCLVQLLELEEAEEYYRRSLAICEREYGVDNPWTVYALQGLGRCLTRAGRLDEASEYLERAIAVQELAVGEDSPELCEILHSLAELEQRRGNYKQSSRLAERSIEILEVSLGTQHPLLARAMLLSANAQHGMGMDEIALEHALRAEEISREHLRATMGVLSEQLALDYGSSRVTGLDLAISMLVDEERGPRVAKVWDQVIRSRAIVLDEMASRGRDLAEREDGVDAELVEGLRAARARLANLSLRGPGWEEVSAYRLMLTQAREEKETAERVLALANRRFRDEEELQTHGLDEVTSTLSDGDQLVAFVRHEPDADSARYAAFTLDGVGSAPRFVDLGSVVELDALVTAWHEQAAYGSRGAEVDEQTRGFVRRSRDTQGQQSAYDEAARALRRRAWDPIVAETDGVAHRRVVSDGSLHLVNFDALVEEDGSYVLEDGPLLSTLSTERSLCAAVRPRVEQPRLLIVGDPSYAAADPGVERTDDECPSLEELRFEPLQGAREEAEELLDLWTRAHETPPRLLVGSEATEESIKREAPDYEVLHLATHGFLLSAACAEGIEDWGARSNPLLRSGLAFAVAERGADDLAGGEDGILTAEEVAGLDLSDLDWAVLSACDTGLGEISEQGEGVFGLSRSFQIAGARTVVMSLWAVDDEATRSWMQSLYGSRFTDGRSTAEAVRAASLSALQELRDAGRGQHPYYWAGFVALGAEH